MHAFGEKEDLITKEIIGKAIAIHRVLGPGLLESVYEYFLAHELRNGLLINFHSYRLADGIKRLSLTRTG
jgi:hypothetical protein